MDYAHGYTAHFERTIDEAYFPGLSKDQLEERNKDQKVSSNFKSNPELTEDEVPVIIVPQLWIWKRSNVLITAQSTWLQSDTGNIRSTNNASVTMGYLVAASIKKSGQEQWIPSHGRVPPILDLFESKVVSVLSEVKAYMQNAKRNVLDYDTEASFHHDLSDCRSELAMVKFFLAQQDEILLALLKEYNQFKITPSPTQQDAPKQPGTPISGSSKADASTTHGDVPDTKSEPPRQEDWIPVEEAYMMLKKYQERVRKIDGDAERIEKTVQDLLNLKRTYASVQDSHASVLMSAAAIGFAVVTIVFAPLAFLTALFALDLQGFDKLRVQQARDLVPDAASRDAGGDTASTKNEAFDSGKIAGIFGMWDPAIQIHAANDTVTSSGHRNFDRRGDRSCGLDLFTLVRH